MSATIKGYLKKKADKNQPFSKLNLVLAILFLASSSSIFSVKQGEPCLHMDLSGLHQLQTQQLVRRLM